VEGNDALAEGREVDDRNEMGNCRETPLGDDFAPATDRVERDGDPDRGIESSPEQVEGLLVERGVVESEIAQLAVPGEPVDEPDDDVGLTLERLVDRSELAADRCDVSGRCADQADPDDPAQIEIDMWRHALPAAAARRMTSSRCRPLVVQSKWVAT
jgi:hypothetical protein